MLLKINGVVIASNPNKFVPSIMDLDDAETTTRTADGSLTRDRIAVKRQIEIGWPPLPWDKMSAILQAMQDESFEFYYPDPKTGTYETKTMYVGNRQAPMAFEKNGEIWWSGLELTLTED